MIATFLHYDNLNLAIEIAGTIAFSMSGAFTAMKYELDPFGVLIIAFLTAVGGGTIRDILLDVPVFWMHDVSICLVILVTAIVVMIFRSLEHNFKNTLFIFDSLGLGLFTIVGVQKGIEAGLNPLISITLGTITGCFGGVLRDILINRIPLLLRKEIYATACIFGGAIFLALNRYTHVPKEIIHLITIISIVLIRIFSVKFKWQIPKFYI